MGLLELQEATGLDARGMVATKQRAKIQKKIEDSNANV